MFKNNLDTFLDTGKDFNKLNKYVENLEGRIDNPVSYSIPEKARENLLTFSFNDYVPVEKQIGMIFRAKKEVWQRVDSYLVIEDFEEDFINQTRILALAIFKDKKSLHKIKNYDSYIFKSYVRYFADQADKLAQIQEKKEKNYLKYPFTITLMAEIWDK